jgi:hypothetical protein
MVGVVRMKIKACIVIWAVAWTWPLFAAEAPKRLRDVIPTAQWHLKIDEIHWNPADKIVPEKKAAPVESFLGAEPVVRILAFRYRFNGIVVMRLHGKSGRLVWVGNDAKYYCTDFEVDPLSRAALQRTCLEEEFFELAEEYGADAVQDGPVVDLDVGRSGEKPLKSVRCEGHFPNVVRRLLHVYDVLLESLLRIDGQTATEMSAEEYRKFFEEL